MLGNTSKPSILSIQNNKKVSLLYQNIYKCALKNEYLGENA